MKQFQLFRGRNFRRNVAQLKTYETKSTLDSVVQVQKFTLGVSEFLGNESGGVTSVKYCDNTKVDDDITDCDIGEIAWECPDGATGPSEDCKADVHGSFD